MDSFFIPDNVIVDNLNDIIKLKISAPNDVTLLLGNHDAYRGYYGGPFNGSGFNHNIAPSISKIFDENRPLFKMALLINNHLFTHAGINKIWWNINRNDNEDTTIDVYLNNLLTDKNLALWWVGYERGGINKTGGPLWCDLRELIKDPLKGYIQHVGHTQVNRPFIKRGTNYKIYFHDFIPSQASENKTYKIIDTDEIIGGVA